MPVPSLLDHLYRTQSRRVLATLIRLLGDFELAEESMHEAFAAALQQWPEQGIPDTPTAWLISAGRHKGIDQIRRRQTASQHRKQQIELDEIPTHNFDDSSINDDQLRLIFTCCHPSLALETRLALTLREMCSLTTEQVARSLLQQPATIAQRIVRAKRKIRDAAIPYEVPEGKALSERLHSVLRVVYLVFNEGYSSSEGATVTKVNLADEAVRLGRLLSQLLPQAEVYGLLALMLLQDSRRAARQGSNGELVPLEEQDRQLWDAAKIAEGLQCLDAAMQMPQPGVYSVQAAIAAEHARAASAADTDWGEIAELYDVLIRLDPSPVISLNRAVAVAMRDGPQAGLVLLEQLADAPELQSYHLFHAARADLQRRAGDVGAAREAFQRAIGLTRQEPERRFLQRRLDSLG
ncbi:RNA polymerase sigma factor [Pseudomonas sp. gcc21]|uniref:RNA polymerase sigma factor n=1 Tax=Pseudomonas sp. gcc21 TaxID=2726989 RepID=UPI00145134FF|nr:RNA polymerase sigma factor [Pseudomonas sp. gcc21]QJD58047.1 RNA polymerase sigma factor [Pseudomonas sp. gcc21]